METSRRNFLKASALITAALSFNGYQSVSAMGLKEAQDSVRQLMTLTNLGAGWAWAAYGYAQEWDLTGALKYAGAGLAGKYLFNNPAVTTFVAQKLKALWKEWLITKVIKSPSTQRLIRWEAIKLSQ